MPADYSSLYHSGSLAGLELQYLLLATRSSHYLEIPSHHPALECLLAKIILMGPWDIMLSLTGCAFLPSGAQLGLPHQQREIPPPILDVMGR